MRRDAGVRKELRETKTSKVNSNSFRILESLDYFRVSTISAEIGRGEICRESSA